MRIRLCVYMCVHTLTHELAKATARHEISMREAKGMWDGERSRMEDALKAERARSDELVRAESLRRDLEIRGLIFHAPSVSLSLCVCVSFSLSHFVCR